MLALKIKLKKMLGKQDSDDEDAGPTRLEGASGDSASDDESDGARGRAEDDESEDMDADGDAGSRRKGKGKEARRANSAGGQDRKKRPRPKFLARRHPSRYPSLDGSRSFGASEHC